MTKRNEGPKHSRPKASAGTERRVEEAPHVHNFGPVERSRFTGNPHRKCACGLVSLDIDDEEREGDK